MVLLLAVPLLALVFAGSPSTIQDGVAGPLFGPALRLSLGTSLISLAILMVLGTPLAWWLGRAKSRWVPWVSTLVDVPIVLPPAVVGLALLLAFGRQGVFGAWLQSMGVTLAFSTTAVVLAQVVVAAPFYVQAAAAAFAAVDEELLLVARTLGRSPGQVFTRVALPLALPGLISGAAVAWARALGEFGATLLFAGNMSGTTQTMPLAIYQALESNVDTAVALALVLGLCAVSLLVCVRLVSRRWSLL
jgi:molybdate transport system permease protein